MWRTLAAVIAGYVTMALIVFAGLTAAYLAMGTARAFEPGSYDVSKLWIVVSIVVMVAAALAGGFVCGKVAKTGTAVKVLIGVVVVLGLFSAVSAMNQPAPATPRPESLTNFEAMTQAKPPAWAGFMNVLIGVVGVAVGAGRKAPRNIV